MLLLILSKVLQSLFRRFILQFFSGKNRMLPTIICLVIACSAVFTGYIYHNENENLEGAFKIGQLKYDLNTQIYGQTEALNALVNNLAMGPHYSHAGLIFLIGGTGVGKTLALSLVRVNYEPSKMIISLLQQNLNSVCLRGIAMAKVKKLTRVSGVGLVTIDNADIKSSELWAFVESLNEFCMNNRVRVKVVVAAQLFQYVRSGANKNLISNSFKNSDEYVNYIKDKYKNVCAGYTMCMAVLFKPIGIATLEKCINSVARTLNGVTLAEKQITSVIDQISEKGLDYVPSGCKSVESYVAILYKDIF